MNLATLAAVAIGGSLGAVLRYRVDVWAVARSGGRWPWGTLIVNVGGSLLIGLLLGTVLATDLSSWWLALLVTGFCGALTTFSGFALQIVELIGAPLAPHADEKQLAFTNLARGFAYAALSLGLGLLVAGAVPLVFSGVNSGHAVN